ncbi:MAG: OadG family protein [Chloroflexi bacterium]|nr:OadG family protein [Chloroflexota bacterium]MBI5350805.1 OadG family protein [Chloroflexota bacterium]
MSEITQGLIVSAFGLGITFAALTLIIIVISLLKRIFQSKEEVEVEIESASAGVEVSEEEVAAAIAVALSHIRSSHPPTSLGASLESGRGAWWRARRNK